MVAGEGFQELREQAIHLSAGSSTSSRSSMCKDPEVVNVLGIFKNSKDEREAGEGWWHTPGDPGYPPGTALGI